MAEATAAALTNERVAEASRAMLVVDDDCVCVEASIGACRLLATGRRDLIGRPVGDLLEPQSAERFGHVWEAFRRSGGQAEPFELEPPATAVEVAVRVTAEVLPSRHLLALTPRDTGEREIEAADDDALLARELDAAPAPRSPTAREREVLGLLAAGATDGQIASLLDLSPATVQTHVRNAKAKLGARTRAQAVAMALQRGLIEG